MVLFNTIDTGMPNMSSRNAHCAWPYPLPNAVTRTCYIPRAFPAPRGRAAAPHGPRRARTGTHSTARRLIDCVRISILGLAPRGPAGRPAGARGSMRCIWPDRRAGGVWAGGRGISMWHVGGPPRRAAGRARGARAPTCCLRVAAGRPAPTPRAATHASRGPPARGLESRRRASRRARPLLRGVVGLGSQRSLY